MKIEFLSRRFGAFKEIIPAALLLGSLSLALAPAARAQITFDFTYDGSDTTLTYLIPTGAFADISRTNSFTSTQEVVRHSVATNTLWQWDGGERDGYYYSTAPVLPWGPRTMQSADSFTYNIPWYTSDFYLALPAGYNLTTGEALYGTQTYNGRSPTDLGFRTDENGLGTFTWAGSTAAWTVTNISPVPEPSAWGLLFGVLALGIVGLSWGGGRRAAVRCDPT